MEPLSLDQLQSNFPRAYEDLAVNRNEKWILKIEQILDSDEVEMVWVGALHLVGDEGLLSLLESRGLTVNRCKIGG